MSDNFWDRTIFGQFLVTILGSIRENLRQYFRQLSGSHHLLSSGSQKTEICYLFSTVYGTGRLFTFVSFHFKGQFSEDIGITRCFFNETNPNCEMLMETQTYNFSDCAQSFFPIEWSSVEDNFISGQFCYFITYGVYDISKLHIGYILAAE